MNKISLKAARVNAGLTQDEIAEKMGVSRQTILAWENGKRRIRPVWFNFFCSVVELEPDDVFLPEINT